MLYSIDFVRKYRSLDDAASGDPLVRGSTAHRPVHGAVRWMFHIAPRPNRLRHMRSEGRNSGYWLFAWNVLGTIDSRASNRWPSLRSYR